MMNGGDDENHVAVMTFKIIVIVDVCNMYAKPLVDETGREAVMAAEGCGEEGAKVREGRDIGK